MKVKILKAFAWHKVGDEIDVSEKLATRYCESGRACLLKEDEAEKPAAESEPAAGGSRTGKSLQHGK